MPLGTSEATSAVTMPRALGKRTASILAAFLLALVLVYGATLYLPTGHSGTSMSATSVPTETSTSTLTTTLTTASTTTATSTSTATTDTDPTNDLELRLYLNTSSSVRTRSNFSIFADSYNPSTSVANITAENDWVVPLNSTNGAPCGDEGQTVGFAVAEGHYTSSNITAAKLLDLVNPLATYNCPLYFGYGSPTGFIFQPASDGGASYGCVGVSPTCPTGNATATYDLNPLTVTGYYQGDTFTSFAPRTYTVLAEDEWGALVLAYFRAS
jgi:hypothetical protein